MRCDSPRLINAWKVSERYALKRSVWKLPSQYYVGCGNCPACEIRHSLEWAHRVLDEYSGHSESCFITLTYNDENVPEDFNLVKKDYQDFLKRLRFHFSDKQIRYFGCGEYGGTGSQHRPHYHIILFGLCFDDLFFFKYDDKGQKLFRSPTLEKLWTFGYSTIGIEFDISCVKYICKYLQKQNIVVADRVKPFVFMSKGIGKNAIKEDLIETDKIYHDGKFIRLPNYYLNVLERDGFNLDTLKYNRMKKCVIFDSDI